MAQHSKDNETGKSKQKNEHDVEFAEGGTTKMFGEQEADEADEGETGKKDDRGPGDKYASGGSTKMFGYSPAVPAKAGITGPR